MQLKKTRGVQQEEVWAAADALLAIGQRPTIERVRQHLGRGSPNTVAPMLEAWFSGLGKRLGMVGDEVEEGAMPAAVVQAMTKMWDAALLAAGNEADVALAQERQALTSATAALSERESGLAQQEQAFEQRQGMVDQLLQAERDKTASVDVRLTASQEQLRQRDSVNTELCGTLAEAQELLVAARNQIDEQARRHAEDRERVEKRAAGNERRLLADIDRERLATKQAKAEAAEASERLQAARNDFEKRTMTLGQKLHASDMELGIARHALKVSEGRCTELKDALQQQRETNGAMLEKLNQTVATMTAKREPSKRKTTAGQPKYRSLEKTSPKPD